MSEASKLTILVADKSAYWTRMLHQYLSSDDYHIQVVADGLQALQIIDKEKIDLLICELDLPEIPGAQLIKMIKARSGLENLPVIVYTSQPQENWKADLKGLAQGGFLKYETEVKELAETVKSICHK